MKLVLSPRSTGDPKLVKKLKALLPESPSLEELVLTCLQSELTMNITRRREDGIHVLCIGLTEFLKKQPSAFIFITEHEYEQWGRCKPVDTTVIRNKESGELEPDHEWYNTWAKRLRIKADPWEGVITAPPGSLYELVMSYVTTKRGHARISRELAELDHRGCCEVAELTLQAPAKNQEGLVQEQVSIEFRKLQILVENRTRKVQRYSDDRAMCIN